MLSPEEIKKLSVLEPWRGYLAFALDFALVALSFGLVILFPHPLGFIVAFVLNARTQLAFAILMHDAVHGRLSANRQWNDRLGQWIAASLPILFSFQSYRRLHLRHHQDPMAATDPDLSLTRGYPISRASFARKLFRDAVGISYFKIVKYFFLGVPVAYSGQDSAQPTLGQYSQLTAYLMIQSIIFGSLWLAGHPIYFVSLWLIPGMTLLQVFLRIRGITEHAGYSQNDNQLLNARTISRRSWQTFLFAPHYVHLHMEHHRYVSVPFYHLPQAHALLRARGVLPAKNLHQGYGSVLAELVTRT